MNRMSEIKPLLRQMVDNNKPYWRPRTIRGAHKLLDDYEAKAKAFDEICKAHAPLEKRMSPVTIDEGLDFAEETEEIILKYYESGEYDD